MVDKRLCIAKHPPIIVEVTLSGLHMLLSKHIFLFLFLHGLKVLRIVSRCILKLPYSLHAKGMCLKTRVGIVLRDVYTYEAQEACR